MLKRPITIRDIAAAAGVHFTTVSLALRDDPRAAAQTREHVKKVAARLGYRPNPLVSALMVNVRTGRRRRLQATLAFCTYWEDGEGWRRLRTHRQFFESAQQRAEAMGYQLSHFNLNEKGISLERRSQIFRARGIRGLILASFQEPVHEIRLNWADFCAVRIDPNPKNPHLDTVSTHQTQVTRVAFRQTQARGFTRIGLAVNKFWDQRLADGFLAGYLTEQAEVPPRQRVPPFRTVDWTAAAFKQWYNEVKPDALIAMDDLVVCDWLKEVGVEVPGKFGFATLDHVDTTGRFAGMRKNHAALGATAVDMLIGRLQHNELGVPEFPKLTLVAGKWVEGASLRPLPPGVEDPSASIG